MEEDIECKIIKQIENTSKDDLDNVIEKANLKYNIDLLQKLVDDDLYEHYGENVLEAIDDLLNELKTKEEKEADLKSKLNIAEKMIDEMADFIVVNTNNLAIDFCKGKDENSCKLRYELGNCDYCIKEYFRRRVDKSEKNRYKRI